MEVAPTGAVPPAAVVAMRRTMTEYPGTPGTLSSSPEGATVGAEEARALRLYQAAALAGTVLMDVVGSAVILDRPAARGVVEMTEVTETGEALLATSGLITAAGVAIVQARWGKGVGIGTMSARW